jgi:hypothetical protein
MKAKIPAATAAPASVRRTKRLMEWRSDELGSTQTRFYTVIRGSQEESSEEFRL